MRKKTSARNIIHRIAKIIKRGMAGIILPASLDGFLAIVLLSWFSCVMDCASGAVAVAVTVTVEGADVIMAGFTDEIVIEGRLSGCVEAKVMSFVSTMVVSES